MRSERVTEEEIESAMRQQKFATLNEVGTAMLETDGSVTIILRADSSSASTLTDVVGRPNRGEEDTQC